MRSAVGAAAVAGTGISVLAVVRALEQADVPSRTLALVAVAGLVAVLYRGAPFGRELWMLAFVFCAIPASRVSFPLIASAGLEQTVYIRPAIVLMVACVGANAFRRPDLADGGDDRGAALFLAVGAAAAILAMLAGYFWLSRHYSLEWQVLREAMLNGLVIGAGYFVIADAGGRREMPRVSVAPVTLALIVMAGLQWARGA